MCIPKVWSCLCILTWTISQYLLCWDAHQFRVWWFLSWIQVLAESFLLLHPLPNVKHTLWRVTHHDGIPPECHYRPATIFTTKKWQPFTAFSLRKQCMQQFGKTVDVHRDLANVHSLIGHIKEEILLTCRKIEFPSIRTIEEQESERGTGSTCWKWQTWRPLALLWRVSRCSGGIGFQCQIFDTVVLIQTPTLHVTRQSWDSDRASRQEVLLKSRKAVLASGQWWSLCCFVED